MKIMVALLLVVVVNSAFAKDAIINLYGWNYSEPELKEVYSQIASSYTEKKGIITHLDFRVRGNILQVVDETLVLVMLENESSSGRIVAVTVPSTENLVDDQYISIGADYVGKYEYITAQNTKKTVRRFRYISGISYSSFMAELRRSSGKTFPEVAIDARQRLAGIDAQDKAQIKKANDAEQERIRKRNIWINGSSFNRWPTAGN